MLASSFSSVRRGALRLPLFQKPSISFAQTPLISRLGFTLNSTFSRSFVTSVVKWSSSLSNVAALNNIVTIYNPYTFLTSEKELDLSKSDLKKVGKAEKKELIDVENDDQFIQKCILEDSSFEVRNESKKFSAYWNSMSFLEQLSWLYRNGQTENDYLGKFLRGIAIKRLEGAGYLNAALGELKAAQRIILEKKKSGELSQKELRLEKIILKEIKDITSP